VSRIVVDPVTRIEGHLRVEAQVDGGKVTEAWSSTTMWRGLEKILVGRDPRDAWYFAQRICGVCTTVHALASVRAVEAALDINPPTNARLLRDLISASQYVHDHVVHFYHLHALDWVDVTGALKADPKKTATLAQSLSDYPESSAAHFTAVRQRLQAFVQGGRLGPFSGGYWNHPAMTLPPEVDLLAVSHYLAALDFQRDYARVHAILGGKSPHLQTYLVGGMASPIDLNSQDAINAGTFQSLRGLLQKGLDFVQQAYLPDLVAIAKAYPEWTKIGGGLDSFLAFGDMSREPPRSGELVGGALPSGVLRKGASQVEAVDPTLIAEDVARAWYTYPGGDGKALSPFDGETNPHYTGPNPPYEYLNVDSKYSWLKAPRYDSLAVEVGPLARMMIGYVQGDSRIRPVVAGALHELGASPTVLVSTLGRTLARGLETLLMARYSLELLDALEANVRGGDLSIFAAGKWEPDSWPAHAQGAGFVEAPRGGLSHWVVISDQKIHNYQAVVPSTWNGSPRDAQGQPGAYEAALVGTPVADPTRPLEVLRVLHSFDPCMACAAHLIDVNGRPLAEVRVQ
jgi:Ni,Fe-hydrogenase I large subunit